MELHSTHGIPPPSNPWVPLFWTVGALGVIAFIADAFETPKKNRHCGVCGRTNHDARNCPFDGPRERLAIVKTGWCQCCKRRGHKTVGHHYGGRADGSKGKELCDSCHLHCGHAGHFQNLGINPRYCRLSFK